MLRTLSPESLGDWAMPVELKKLLAVADVSMGQSPPSANVGEKLSGLPFLQGNAEFADRFPSSHSRCNAPGRICDSGDILLSVRAPVGEINQADQPYAIG